MLPRRLLKEGNQQWPKPELERLLSKEQSMETRTRINRGSFLTRPPFSRPSRLLDLPDYPAGFLVMSRDSTGVLQDFFWGLSGPLSCLLSVGGVGPARLCHQATSCWGFVSHSWLRKVFGATSRRNDVIIGRPPCSWPDILLPRRAVCCPVTCHRHAQPDTHQMRLRPGDTSYLLKQSTITTI